MQFNIKIKAPLRLSTNVNCVNRRRARQVRQGIGSVAARSSPLPAPYCVAQIVADYAASVYGSLYLLCELAKRLCDLWKLCAVECGSGGLK